MQFSDFSLARELQASLRRVGFERPTAIQEQAIPAGLEGRDVLASAETGSGKTAAFLLPIMHQLLPLQRGTTRALVVAPTRELASQIAESFRELAVGTRLTCAAVFGGVSMGAQERAFKTGVDLIVACPGRLLDHMKDRYAALSSVSFLVLDEADRMLDMGFLPDIKRVLAKLPRQRQTFFFSATLPQSIVELANGLLHDPVRINVGRVAAPAHGVSQSVYPVHSTRKNGLMLELLSREVKGSVLVFTRTKHRANRLADFLDKNGVPCARIHGNRSQSQRTLALSGFKNGKFRVLVATDIAARGIDVEELGAVVNFDVPHVPEDYIHRVGRTARADKVGDALTLVSPEEETDFKQIERAIGKRVERQTMERFDYKAQEVPPQGAGSRGGAGEHSRGGPHNASRGGSNKGQRGNPSGGSHNGLHVEPRSGSREDMRGRSFGGFRGSSHGRRG